MSSGECEYEGCHEPAKGKYCPEHEADYEDMLWDAWKDRQIEEKFERIANNDIKK